jgi:CRISPR-associated exonuclease Cas4
MAEGCWKPYPVEYKRGAVKPNPMDEAQLCAQAMCLEEMLCCEISEGALFYGETRHRCLVSFTPELRQEVTRAAQEMHQLFRRGSTPKVKPTKACNACSLKDICLPKLMRAQSVSAYLHRQWEETP